MKRLSLLEFLHPDGCVMSSMVIGGNCPEILIQSSPYDKQNEPFHVGLIVIAPTREECSQPGWIQDAVSQMAIGLSPDGVGYIIAPSLTRLKILLQIMNAGFFLDKSYGHLPDWKSSNWMVPFVPGPLQYTFKDLLSAPTWKKHLVRWGTTVRGLVGVLAFLWPSAGLVVRRKGARPLFNWLNINPERPLQVENAVLHSSWRGQDGGLVLFCFLSGEQGPSIVAKVSGNASQSGEQNILAQIGASAEQTGVRVPKPLFSLSIAGRTLWLQKIIPGQPANEFIRAKPERLQWLLDRLVSWLEYWNKRTMHIHPLEDKLIQESLLEPISVLVQEMEYGKQYLDWFTSQRAAVLGVDIPLVAAHQDLTLSNILIDQDGQLGIIDWETARLHTWPLLDFFYVVTDAVMTALTPGDRLKAFQVCFTEKGPVSMWVSQWQDRLCSELGITSQVARLSFHTCWLHHAQNEHLKNLPAGSRSFLPIIQWVVDHLEQYDEAKP